MKNTVRIVFVIIATLVGAGFTSGREVYSFFFIYGLNGLVGIGISSCLISIVVYRTLKICSTNNISNYQDFCDYIINRNTVLKKVKANGKVAIGLNRLVNALLLITFFIMISGFSSFLNQEFSIDKYLGSTLVVIVCYITFRKNVEGLIKISNFLVPVLIVFLLVISSKNIRFMDNYYGICDILNTNHGSDAICKAILYAGYNCILLIPVLITLARQWRDGLKKIWLISVCCFIVIIILSTAIFNILLLGDLVVFSLDMPLIEIVKRYGMVYQYGYLFMIAISIYTTAISTGCGFLNGVCKDDATFNRYSMYICITAVFLSQISFSVLVGFLYPVLGVLGLIEIFLI